MKVRWRGLEEFRQALQNLPDDLRTEADNIVRGWANAAAFEIRSRYAAHRRTGKLQESVKVDAPRGRRRFAVRWRVRAWAPHAHLVEYGTQTRQTTLGASRGIMPAFPTFIPAYRAHRARMYDALKAMLVRHGLLVRGDA